MVALIYVSIRLFMFQCWCAPIIFFQGKEVSCLLFVNIMIKGSSCRTKKRPAIQLCYLAVSCSRQVVPFFLQDDLGSLIFGNEGHNMPGVPKEIQPSKSQVKVQLIVLMVKYFSDFVASF